MGAVNRNLQVGPTEIVNSRELPCCLDCDTHFIGCFSTFQVRHDSIIAALRVLCALYARSDARVRESSCSRYHAVTIISAHFLTWWRSPCEQWVIHSCISASIESFDSPSLMITSLSFDRCARCTAVVYWHVVGDMWWVAQGPLVGLSKSCSWQFRKYVNSGINLEY